MNQRDAVKQVIDGRTVLTQEYTMIISVIGTCSKQIDPE